MNDDVYGEWADRLLHAAMHAHEFNAHACFRKRDKHERVRNAMLELLEQSDVRDILTAAANTQDADDA
jgi:hypothetical protein